MTQDDEHLIAEVDAGLANFAYGPGAGMVARLRRRLAELQSVPKPSLPSREEVDCNCFQCTKVRTLNDPDAPVMVPGTRMYIALSRMFCCENCGNKRCPHATDHRFKCSGSNDSGQPGSAYEHAAAPPSPLSDRVERLGPGFDFDSLLLLIDCELALNIRAALGDGERG